LNNVNICRNAAKFVIEKGDDISKLHLLHISGLLWTRVARDLMTQLLVLQMPSGAFPSSYCEIKEGVKETCRNAHLLLQCGTPADETVIQSAVSYLVNCQHDNGGWSENPNLTLPEEVIELSNTEVVTWLTADIIDLLRKVHSAGSGPCKKALCFLREAQNPDGGWSMFKRHNSRGSDPDSTAQILFLFRDVFGEEDPAYKRGIEFFERSLDRIASDVDRGYYLSPIGEEKDLDVYHLTHVLFSSLVDTGRRFEAGYGLKDNRVRKIAEKVIETQREDGGWRPFWTEQSDPRYTTLALKFLVFIGTISQEELETEVRQLL
jgi:hypothetical protein